MVKLGGIQIFFVVLLLSACSLKESEKLPSYSLIARDFENTIAIGGFVEPVNSTTMECPRFVDGVVIYLVEDGTYVQEGDTVCKLEMQMLVTQYEQFVTDLENARAGLNKSKAELDLQYALMEAQVRNNEAQAQISSLDSLQLEYASPTQRRIKELELQQSMIQKEKFEKKLTALEIINQSEVRKLEIQIQQFENRVKSMQDQLDQLIIKAPRSGLATRPIYRITNTQLNAGDPVWGAMPLVVIPDVAEMKVKIMAPEQDYRYINVDDSVYYSFDAMPGNYAWGKITKKAPVGQPYKHDSRVKYFEIEASIDSCLTLPEPGFTANCRIVMQQVKDTLIIPRIAVFQEDSIRVVFVETPRGYEMRQVETGLSSAKETVITAGLNREERIALTRPRERLVKKQVLLPVIPDKEDEREEIDEPVDPDKQTLPVEPDEFVDE